MKPFIVDNFLNNVLLNQFLDLDIQDDYIIEKISHHAGTHFINCDKMVLDYNKGSKVECLINHIIKFINSIKDDIYKNVTISDINDVKCVEYWNKHLVTTNIKFHFDIDEQDLLNNNTSNLSVVYYFKRKYENGLLLINKKKNYSPSADKSILYKNRDEILNDITITNNYHIVEPLFNRLVFFNGGEYWHGVTQVNTLRDSLVMNLWINPPLKNKIIKHRKHNIYVIERVIHEDAINDIRRFMNKYCDNDNSFALSNYINNNKHDKEANDMDNLIFLNIHKLLNYMEDYFNGAINVLQDSGYNLIKAKDSIIKFKPSNKILYIEFTLDDIEYEFDNFDNVKVNKNSFLIIPYCWSYNFKIINENYIMRIVTDMT
jgi:hypothetical protein